MDMERFVSKLTFLYSSDIDECSIDNDCDSVNAKCEDTVGSYRCTCNVGFEGNGIVCEGRL